MLDYKGIEALYTVQELQSFEAAAKKLHITQSAVSQRIKGLEMQYGEPVLIRTQPYRPTRLGKKLIGHFKRICLLEEELESLFKKEAARPHLAIALNRDSLETWFLDLMEDPVFANIRLEIIADDQELTLNYLKNGLVSACLSTSEKEIVGGLVEFVGNMEYVLAASPELAKKHFSKEGGFLTAPAVKFDESDKMHQRYLEKFFGFKEEVNFHVIPSVRGFKKWVLLGYGYGLIPIIDIGAELKSKQLVDLFPSKRWTIPLYWHYFAIQSKLYQKFNTDMIRLIRQKLNRSDGA